VDLETKNRANRIRDTGSVSRRVDGFHRIGLSVWTRIIRSDAGPVWVALQGRFVPIR